MPQFTRDINPVGAVNPIITDPIQDNTLAEGIAAASEIGITAAKKSQQARGRELGQQFTSELVTTALAPETGSQLTQGDFVGESVEANRAFETARKEGRKLGKAKTALGEGAFRVRAEASLKNLMASHPFFSDEIARGFAAETGFDPRGATVAEAFQSSSVLISINAVMPQRTRSGISSMVIVAV